MVTGKAGCGLQYAIKKSGNAVGYCSLTIKCGSRDEEGFHSGIAHFTEHTLFKGTSYKNARTINSYLDQLGGDLNAFTTREEIVLHATVLKEDIGKAVSLLLELATCPTFPVKEIAVEKGVVIEEIKSYKDTPADDICDEFEENFFKGHPLGSRILGTASSVRRITSAELHRFVRKWFAPGNMALAVVADEDETRLEEQVLTLVQKAFEGHEATHTQRTAIHPEAPVLFNTRRRKRNHEANAVIGCLAPSLYDTDERFNTILLNNILGGQASNSLLNDLLREQNGWVYSVESWYTQFEDAGLLEIVLACEKSNLEKCLDAVRSVVSSLCEEQLTESRLKAAKKQLLGQMAISSDNGEAQCLSMGKSLTAFGTVCTPEEDRRKIEAVSAASLQNTAARIFSPQRTSSLIFI